MNANSIFQSGDIVLIITLILLILMSVASWSIAVLKTLEFHRTCLLYTSPSPRD